MIEWRLVTLPKYAIGADDSPRMSVSRGMLRARPPEVALFRKKCETDNWVFYLPIGKAWDASNVISCMLSLASGLMSLRCTPYPTEYSKDVSLGEA